MLSSSSDQLQINYTRVIKKKEEKLEILLFENEIVRMYIEIPLFYNGCVPGGERERGNTCRVMMLSLMANHRASHYHSRAFHFLRGCQAVLQPLAS